MRRMASDNWPLRVSRRVRVDFTTNGRPTGKYYYQTHVQLGSAERLTVLADRP